MGGMHNVKIIASHNMVFYWYIEKRQNEGDDYSPRKYLSMYCYCHEQNAGLDILSLK